MSAVGDREILKKRSYIDHVGRKTMGKYYYPLVLAVFCRLITVIGTSTTDVHSLHASSPTQESLPASTTGPIITTTLKLTTLNPKEAARLAAIELSKQIFRNITKQLRDSIAAKNFSVFSTAPPIDEQDELHPFRHQPKHHHEHHWGPYFDESLPGSGALQVRAHLASEAILNCRVGMLRDKTVMWLRRLEDKVHLLTVGATTYSGDSRVSVKFQYPNNWRLSLNPVQKEDAGLYMCQVSTHPPRVLLTNVTVLAPILRIVDEQGHEVKDRYYKAGSSIELSCKVSRAFSGSYMTTTALPLFTTKSTTTTTTTTQQPNTTTENLIISRLVDDSSESSLTNKNSSNVKSTNSSIKDITDNDKAPENNVFGITWHKDGKVLTDKVIAKNMSSTFKQKHAEQKDGGSYSCSILNTSTVTVQVHVLSGETQAAVQHDTLNKAEHRILSVICALLTIFVSTIIVLQ